MAYDKRLAGSYCGAIVVARRQKSSFLRSSLSLARYTWRANFDNSLRVHPRGPVVLREALPDFGLDNLLNRGISPSYRTVIGLGDSFFLFLLEKKT